MSLEIVKRVIERMSKDKKYEQAMNKKFNEIYKQVVKMIEDTVKEMQQKGEVATDAILVAKLLDSTFSSFTLEQFMRVLAFMQYTAEGAREDGYTQGFVEGTANGMAMTIKMVKIGKFGS